MTLPNLTALEQEVFSGRVEYVYQESDHLGTNRFHYVPYQGSKTTQVRLYSRRAGGHQADGVEHKGSGVTDNAPEVSLDSTLKFWDRIPYDYLLEYGQTVPQEIATGLAQQLVTARQILCIAALAGGAGNTVTVTDEEDPDVVANALSEVSEKFTDNGIPDTDLHGAISSKLWHNARKQSYISSGDYTSDSDNRKKRRMFEWLNIEWMALKAGFDLDLSDASVLEDLFFADDVGGSDEQVYVDAKYQIDLSNIIGVVWHKPSIIYYDGRPATGTIYDNVHVRSWEPESRTKFGTKIIQPKGITKIVRGS